jgi:probable selenium-dependent hydroxylase accessory protein YqeC
MESLNAYFEKLGKQIITVIGSGGKTSLIWRLAEHYRKETVLVTTTTRMFLASHDRAYDYFVTDPLSRPPAPGISLGGIPNGATGKLESLSPGFLEKIAPLYDHVLIEGDGSRTLPIKAWADYEPVVPSWTTVTVGVMPLWSLGSPITEALVHRLPLFLALSGARENEALTLHHLVPVISGSPGGRRSLFSAAQGKKILFFNQIESPASLDQARKLAALLPESFRANLYSIIAGSVREDQVTVIATSTRESPRPMSGINP